MGAPLFQLVPPDAQQWRYVHNGVWCDARLTGVPSVTLFLSQEWGGNDWVVRTTVQREEGDAAGMRWPHA